MHQPQRKPIKCFTAAAVQVVRELGSCGEYKYIYNHSLNIESFLGVMDFGQEFFCLGLSIRFAELEFSVEYGLVRATPSGGGSDAPRPAVSVPHIDVNADGCRARRASVEKEFRENC